MRLFSHLFNVSGVSDVPGEILRKLFGQYLAKKIWLFEEKSLVIPAEKKAANDSPECC